MLTSELFETGERSYKVVKNHIAKYGEIGITVDYVPTISNDMLQSDCIKAKIQPGQWYYVMDALEIVKLNKMNANPSKIVSDKQQEAVDTILEMFEVKQATEAMFCARFHPFTEPEEVAIFDRNLVFLVKNPDADGFVAINNTGVPKIFKQNSVKLQELFS